MVKKTLIPHYDVPLDESDPQFIQSFALEDLEGSLDFFHQFGFVVYRDVLSPEECEASVACLFRMLDFDRNDPETWRNWPRTGMEKYGMPSRKPIFEIPFLLNRQNRNVHRGFANILAREDLVSNHDRGCLFRPTVQVPFESGLVNMTQWRTARGLHFDMNPWKYVDQSNNTLKTLESMDYATPNQFIFENNQVTYDPENISLQGVINFLDNYKEDGGFIVVPGFIHHFDEWVRDNSQLSMKTESSYDEESNSFSFAANDPMQHLAIRISMRKGSMVIWDQRMPHGSTFNQSSNFRAAQFLKMFPNQISPERSARRGNALRSIFRMNGFERLVSPLGMGIFSLS